MAIFSWQTEIRIELGKLKDGVVSTEVRLHVVY
jgi:hypothetical protein